MSNLDADGRGCEWPPIPAWRTWPSIAASIAARAATMRQQSNIDFLNDSNFARLKDSALFNLNIAINSLHRTGDLRSFSKTGKAP
jgi:hypothetical protein